MKNTELVIAPDGSITFIHDDDVSESLAHIGQQQIRRASHVEPNHAGLWQADMAPVGGPVLPAYTRRSEALEAEVDWLHEHFGFATQKLFC